MKKKIISVLLFFTIGLVFAGCGTKEFVEQDTEQIVLEESETVIETEMGTETDITFVEPGGRITSGLGAVYDGKLYYAVAEGGCHTGIIERNLSTGEEHEVVSNEDTNGFSYLSVYDGYIYCVWDKYRGTDSKDYQIYRFSLEDFSGEYLVDGCRPVVADRNIYYWNFEWNANGDYQTATLYQFDIDTMETFETGVFGGISVGNVDGYSYNGIYDYYYLDGKIYVGISYEELGDYEESTGLYLCKDDAEKGVIVFDMDGKKLNQSEYGIEYLPASSDCSMYGMDMIIHQSEIVGGGRMIVGYSGENEILSYVDLNGDITTLQTWMPAE